MYLGEVIGPGARCTVTNYNTTSSHQLQVHVLVLYASMAAARSPGPLPALSLVPNPSSGECWDPVSMDFPLQLRFPDARSRSRREHSPPWGTALPVCANAWPLLSPLLLLLRIFPRERGAERVSDEEFCIGCVRLSGIRPFPAPSSKHPRKHSSSVWPGKQEVKVAKERKKNPPKRLNKATTVV